MITDKLPYRRCSYLDKTILLLVGIVSLGSNAITCIDHNTLPQERSTFMIGIFPSLCSRIASRKVLLVFNWPNHCGKILQLSVCVGAGYVGGWQTRICNWPGLSSLSQAESPLLPTPLILKETSQTLFVLLEAEGMQHLARQMEKQHSIYRILNRLYSCPAWIQPALHMQKSSTKRTQEDTSNSGYLGPNFHKLLLKKKCTGKTWVQ